MSEQAIETLLDEERRFPARSRVRRAGERDRRALRRRPAGVLGPRGARARDVVRGLPHGLGVGAAVREVVPRRHAQRRLQLRRPSRRGRSRRPGRLLLGGRAGGGARDDHLRRAAGTRCLDGERPRRSSASARGRRSRSTWGWCRSSRSRCSRARGSAPRTRSSSAASRPTRSRTARTTWAARC